MAGLAAAWRFTPLSEYITGERIIDWARTVRGMKFAPVIVVLSYVPAAFVLFPRPLLTLLTVIAFGPWLGFVYSMAGILLSAAATYYAGRILKPSTVKRLAGDNMDDVAKALKRHGFLSMLAMRIIPAAPFIVEGIIAGALRVKLSDFMLGTFVGMLPGVLATTVFGDQLATALEDPSQINWWIVGAVILAFAALIWFVRRWFSKQG
jgi:uncharacterized membrane protein YdjX (TVP38/TMEM64 family)